MLRLHLVFVGKTSFPEMDAGIERYLDRPRHYVPTEVHVIKAEKIGARSSDEIVMERECERILNLVKGRGHLVAWDQQGRQLGSAELATFLERLRDGGASDVWMVIGGPVGLSPRLLKEADSVLSLSKMTFPHDLARLVIVEQLYRAFTILKGEPYHR